MREPTGSVLPKSSRRTVSPRMHTAVPARSSLSVKLRPDASPQLRTRRNAVVLPVAEVDQFFAAAIAWTGFCAVGATAAIPGTSRAIASASSTLNGGASERAPPEA